MYNNISNIRANRNRDYLEIPSPNVILLGIMTLSKTIEQGVITRNLYHDIHDLTIFVNDSVISLPKIEI